jgi:hypothetical protein
VVLHRDAEKGGPVGFDFQLDEIELARLNVSRLQVDAEAKGFVKPQSRSAGLQRFYLRRPVLDVEDSNVVHFSRRAGQVGCMYVRIQCEGQHQDQRDHLR